MRDKAKQRDVFFVPPVASQKCARVGGVKAPRCPTSLKVKFESLQEQTDMLLRCSGFFGDGRKIGN